MGRPDHYRAPPPINQSIEGLLSAILAEEPGRLQKNIKKMLKMPILCLSDGNEDVITIPQI